MFPYSHFLQYHYTVLLIKISNSYLSKFSTTLNLLSFGISLDSFFNRGSIGDKSTKDNFSGKTIFLQQQFFIGLTVPVIISLNNSLLPSSLRYCWIEISSLIPTSFTGINIKQGVVSLYLSQFF